MIHHHRDYVYVLLRFSTVVVGVLLPLLLKYQCCWPWSSVVPLPWLGDYYIIQHSFAHFARPSASDVGESNPVVVTRRAPGARQSVVRGGGRCRVVQRVRRSTRCAAYSHPRSPIARCASVETLNRPAFPRRKLPAPGTSTAHSPITHNTSPLTTTQQHQQASPQDEYGSYTHPYVLVSACCVEVLYRVEMQLSRRARSSLETRQQQ